MLGFISFLTSSSLTEEVRDEIKPFEISHV